MIKHTSSVWRLSLAILLSVYFSFISSQLAYANENLPSGAFVVRPAKIELSIDPGGQHESLLTLSNGTPFPLEVTVSYEDVAPQSQISANDEPIKLLGKNGGSYPLKDLFSTKDQSLKMLSGEEVRVPVTVHIPKDTEAGGRYGSVVFSFKPIITGDKAQQANVAVESRLATLFYVRINGSAKEQGKLVSFGLFNNAKTSSVPSEETPLKFQLSYENTGAVHVNPYGRLTIKPILGSSKVFIVDPLAVLPSEIRMREIAVRDSLSIGYYKATLELNRGYKDIIDTREVSFWIIPGPEGMLLIVVLTILFFWLIRRSLSLSRHFVQ